MCCNFLSKNVQYTNTNMILKKVLIVHCLLCDYEAIISLSYAVCFRNCLAKPFFRKRAKFSVKLTALNNTFLLGGFFLVDFISSFSSSMILTFSLVVRCSNSSSQSACCIEVATGSQVAIEKVHLEVVYGQALKVRLGFLSVVLMDHQCLGLNPADFVSDWLRLCQVMHLAFNNYITP